MGKHGVVRNPDLMAEREQAKQHATEGRIAVADAMGGMHPTVIERNKMLPEVEAYLAMLPKHIFTVEVGYPDVVVTRPGAPDDAYIDKVATWIPRWAPLSEFQAKIAYIAED